MMINQLIDMSIEAVFVSSIALAAVNTITKRRRKAALKALQAKMVNTIRETANPYLPYVSIRKTANPYIPYVFRCEGTDRSPHKKILVIAQNSTAYRVWLNEHPEVNPHKCSYVWRDQDLRGYKWENARLIRGYGWERSSLAGSPVLDCQFPGWLDSFDELNNPYRYDRLINKEFSVQHDYPDREVLKLSISQLTGFNDFVRLLSPMSRKFSYLRHLFLVAHPETLYEFKGLPGWRECIEIVPASSGRPQIFCVGFKLSIVADPSVEQGLLLLQVNLNPDRPSREL